MTSNLDPGPGRVREANRITAVLAIPLALGVAGTVVPGLDTAVTVVLVGLLALAVLVGLGRLAARLVRERRENREDDITASAWRAAHPMSVTAARVGVA